MKYLLLVVMFVFSTSGCGFSQPAFSSKPVKHAEGFAYTFAGNTTLLFTFGGEAILIDGWFSRFPAHKLPFRKLAPDEDVIFAALTKLGVKTKRPGSSIIEDTSTQRYNLLAVIPGHSHYDHAMDVGAVAKLTGAVVLGSESTANIAKAAGVDRCDEHMAGSCAKVATLRRCYDFGVDKQFQVRLLRSQHLVHRFPLAPIVNPLLIPRGVIGPDFSTPATARAYGEGGPKDSEVDSGTYAIILRHKPTNKVVHIHASTGFVAGEMKNERADMVFLSVAGLPHLEPEWTETFWAETVGQTGASLVVPVHWDDLTAPLGDKAQQPRGVPRFILGGDGDQQSAPLRRQQTANGAKVAPLPELWASKPVVQGLANDVATRPCANKP